MPTLHTYPRSEQERKHGAQPWKASGISRATWYRRRAEQYGPMTCIRAIHSAALEALAVLGADDWRRADLEHIRDVALGLDMGGTETPAPSNDRKTVT